MTWLRANAEVRVLFEIVIMNLLMLLPAPMFLVCRSPIVDCICGPFWVKGQCTGTDSENLRLNLDIKNFCYGVPICNNNVNFIVEFPKLSLV